MQLRKSDFLMKLSNLPQNLVEIHTLVFFAARALGQDGYMSVSVSCTGDEIVDIFEKFWFLSELRSRR